MNIIRETNGVAVIEDDSAYFCVGLDRDNGMQVSSLGADCPRGGGTWVARFCRRGLEYVSSARSRSAAMAMYRKYTDIGAE